MNIIGLLVFLLGGVVFLGSHRYFMRKSVRARVVAFFVFGVLAIPSVLFATYYLHLLPEKAWFYTLRSWRGSEFLAIFVGAAGGVFSTLLPRYLLIIPLGLTLSIALVPYLKMLTIPLNGDDIEDQWVGDACLQSTGSTCGPASCASILRFLGKDASECEIAKESFSTASGTEAWYIARYLRARGLTTRFDFRLTFESTVVFPAMVGVRIGHSGHFIAVLKMVNGIVTMVDPLTGKSVLKTDDFLRRYVFTGFHLSIGK